MNSKVRVAIKNVEIPTKDELATLVVLVSCDNVTVEVRLQIRKNDAERLHKAEVTAVKMAEELQ